MASRKKSSPTGGSLLEELSECRTLAELEETISTKDPGEVRGELLDAFDRLAEYRNATEWNRAVKVCEALAIVGWGAREPVEAVRGVSFNGNPMTTFVNRYGERRFVDAIWSKRKAGLTMEPERTSYHASPDVPSKPTVLWQHPVVEDVQAEKLGTQENWIAKNPIRITRAIANVYASTKPLLDDVEAALIPRLDRDMRPEAYGRALQRITVTTSFSYFDSESNQCNLITFDEDRPLDDAELKRRLAALHTPDDIKQHRYFARNKFEWGNFQSKQGKIGVKVHFSKAFSELSLVEQKRTFIEDLRKAVMGAVGRLGKKRLAYDLTAMKQDFETLLAAWGG